MVRESFSAIDNRELLNLKRSDGKEAKKIMKHTASDVDQVKRSS
jgi:hypothetical protein